MSSMPSRQGMRRTLQVSVFYDFCHGYRMFNAPSSLLSTTPLWNSSMAVKPILDSQMKFITFTAYEKNYAEKCSHQQDDEKGNQSYSLRLTPFCCMLPEIYWERYSRPEIEPRHLFLASLKTLCRGWVM